MAYRMMTFNNTYLLSGALIAAMAAATVVRGDDWTLLTSDAGDIPEVLVTSGTARALVMNEVFDVDLDGDDDWVIGSHRTPGVQWFRQESDGTLTRFVIDAFTDVEHGSEHFDIDSDGDIDLVSGNHDDTGHIHWWENPYPNTTSSWTRHIIGNPHTATHDMVFADADGNGVPELYSVGKGDRNLVRHDIPANPRTASEWPETIIDIAIVSIVIARGIAAGDVDADGDTDLIAAGTWYENDGSGQFQANGNVFPNTGGIFASGAKYAEMMSIAQLIPGGYAEIAVSSPHGEGPVGWSYWDGSAWVPQVLTHSLRSHNLQVADLNLDGHLDIFSAEERRDNNPTPKTWVFYGDSAGNFTEHEISSGIGLHGAKLGDMDSDGDLDIVGQNNHPWKYGPGQVIWLNPIVTGTPPIIDGGPTRVLRVEEGTTHVTDLNATDAEGDSENGGGLSYRFGESDDAGLFDLDTDTGVLSFVTPPDFANPRDADANNTYIVDVIVVDSNGLEGTQTITVIVDDIVAIPDLTGLSQAAAVALLVDTGLSVGTVATTISSSTPPGHVVSQDPAPGVTVSPGAEVNFSVALAPQNDAPVLSFIADQSVTVGNITSLPVSSSDANGDAMSLSLLEAPSFVSLTDAGDGTGTISLEPSQGDIGTHSVSIEVVDDGTPTERDERIFQVTVSAADTGSDTRVSDNLVLLYTFAAGSGQTIFDRSGVSPSIDLLIEDAQAISWHDDESLSVISATTIASSNPAQKLNEQIPAVGAITVEAWIAPAREIGTERIVTVSKSNSQRNITLDQGGGGSDPGTRFDARLRTTQTGNNGSSPFLRTGKNVVRVDELQHVVYTRDTSGAAHIYVDGTPQVSRSIAGTLSNWDASFAVALASDLDGKRPWLGRFALVAMYSRALNAAEVQQNFAAGANGNGDGQPGENENPVAFDDNFSADEDNVLAGNVLNDNGNGGDVDANGHALAVVRVDGSAGNVSTELTLTSGATLFVGSDGGFIYDPRGSALLQALDTGESSQDVFNYTIDDGNGGTSSAVVTITVNGADEPVGNANPIARDDTFSTNADSILEGNVLEDNGGGADSDPDGDTLAVQTSNRLLPSNARIVLAADGTFSYDTRGVYDHLSDGETDVDTFDYTLEDGNLGIDTGTVSITVVGIDPATGGNSAPSINITSPAAGSRFVVGDAIVFSAVANDLEDGNLAQNIVWSGAEGALGSGGTLTLNNAPAGALTVTASVADNAVPALSSSTTITVIVEPESEDNRVTQSLIVLYNFDTGVGDTVFDRSNVNPPLDLVIDDVNAVTWGDDGTLSIDSPTALISSGPAEKLNTLIPLAGAITVEAWIESSRDIGTERIFSVSQDLANRNVTLDKGGAGSAPGSRYDARLRTTKTGNNASKPFLRTAKNVASSEVVQHVAYTRDVDGTARVYVDGDLVKQGSIAGTLLNEWDQSFALVLANEFTGQRPWLGRFALVAVYERALSPAEITQNYTAGPR